jgi:chaperonin GroES
MKQPRVLKGKLLVKQDEAEAVTQGGIIIPDTNKEKPKRGDVIVVGESVYGDPTQMDIGDTVLFAEHAGTPLSLDFDDIDLKGEFLILDQTQVLLIK